jgi:hypothetical protein
MMSLVAAWRSAKSSGLERQLFRALADLRQRGQNSHNVPTGTFRFAEKFFCKLLILRAAFWAEQWNQGVRLWKKCLLSRTSDVY